MDDRPIAHLKNDRPTKPTIARSPTSKTIAPLPQTHYRATSAKQHRPFTQTRSPLPIQPRSPSSSLLQPQSHIQVFPTRDRTTRRAIALSCSSDPKGLWVLGFLRQPNLRRGAIALRWCVPRKILSGSLYACSGTHPTRWRSHYKSGDRTEHG